MGTFLYFKGEGIDIGVPVITWQDNPRLDFAQYTRKDGGKLFIDRANNLFADRRKDVKKVILHHDGVSSSLGCFRTLVGRGLSTHLMIDTDGMVYQPMDLVNIAYHAGDFNGDSIGIDINNPVRPERRQGVHLQRQVFSGPINGYMTTGMGYTDAQYTSLIAVLRGLVEFFPNLPGKAPVGVDGKVVARTLQNATGFAGIMAHFHTSANKWDPGPGFDWERVLTGIKGNRLFYPVTLDGSANLADVPKVDERKVLANAEEYFNAIETGSGGFFPVGANQAWHTGVHFEFPEANKPVPVRSPYKGTIMAARQAKADRLGSPNFLLIRHEKEVEGRPRTFFTVMMHLAEEEKSSTSRVKWLKSIYNRPATDDENSRVRRDANRRILARPGRMALSSGHVVLLEEPVEAGEVVGYVGQFAGARDKPMRRLVDVAIFADRPLIPADDPTFRVVEEDAEGDVLCNSQQVWQRLIADPEAIRGLTEGGYPLSATEVQQAYRAREAQDLRWYIVQHPTEWSDQTDFSGLFGGGVEFDWYARKLARRYRSEIMDYLWWDDEVSRHAKLPKDRVVYAHHPIALLTELALQSAREAFQVGKDGASKGLNDKALRQARQAEAGAQDAHCTLGTSRGLFKSDDFVSEEQEQPDPEDEAWMRWEQGEWPPE